MSAYRLNKDDLIRLLRSRQRGRSARMLAREIGVSAAYMCDLLAGRRDPGPTVLAYLNLERNKEVVLTYRKAKR